MPLLLKLYLPKLLARNACTHMQFTGSDATIRSVTLDASFMLLEVFYSTANLKSTGHSC
jgi:hypothetical protein